MPQKAEKSCLQKFSENLYIAWYSYSVTIPVYHMHPLENLVTNSCVLFFLSFAIWLLLIFLPRLILRILSYLVTVLMGGGGDEVDSLFSMGERPENHTATSTAIAFPTPIR